MSSPDLSPQASLSPVCLLVANSPEASARKTWPTTKSPPSKVSRRSECASLKKVLFSFAARSRMCLSASDSGPARVLPNYAGPQLYGVCLLRHWVVTKLTRQRLAPQQPLQPHPRPPHHTKPLNRLIHVHGASRLKPATPRKQNRQIHLINTQRRQRRFHPSRLLPSRWDRLQSVCLFHCTPAARIHHHTHRLFINRTKSPVNPTNSARATLLFG